MNTQGIPPLEYSITSFNGTPFVFSNGTNNEFVGLQPGIYNFTVEDSCGNIVNRDYDITQLNPPSITAQNLCEGQAAQLSIDLLSFYTYKWWKTTDPSYILSTSHVLNLNPFNNATTPGTYVVELNTTVPNTCTAQQFTYVIHPIVLPYAGNDTVVEFCDAVTTLDLATLLQGNFNAGGNWNQVVPSGNLTGAIWDATGVTNGTYVFIYQVARVVGDVYTQSQSDNKYSPITTTGLVLLNTTNFTNASSVSLNNIFTSSYENYKMVLNLWLS